MTNLLQVGITIGKWVILAILNIVLIVVIARHNLIRKTIFEHAGSPGDSAKSVHPARRHSTYVLMACVAVYFVTQFPNVVFKILLIASQPPYCSYDFTARKQMAARPPIFMCLLANYSLNFLLYCLIWKKFRTQLRYLTHRTLALSGLSGPSTAITSVEGTPGNRTAKMSLENEGAVRLTIAPLLAAAAEHPKLARMGLAPEHSSQLWRILSKEITQKRSRIQAFFQESHFSS